MNTTVQNEEQCACPQTSVQEQEYISPSVNIAETPFGFLVEAEVPGVKKDGVDLHVENDVLDAWIESCRRKKLIVQTGNRYRLHLENPNLKIVPSTKLDERFVTKPQRNADRIPNRYSPSQIEKMTGAAFGNEFAIRKTTDIYLPVHCIVVQNPDGSIHTSHWNALNGKRLQSHSIE